MERMVTLAQAVFLQLNDTERKQVLAWIRRRYGEAGGPPGVELTERELDVLEQMIVGGTNAVLAKRLRITQKTLETHQSSLTKKFGVSGRENIVNAGKRFIARRGARATSTRRAKRR